ncbi:MAG: cytochrome c, partial [Bacteroidota bacterium]
MRYSTVVIMLIVMALVSLTGFHPESSPVKNGVGPAEAGKALYEKYCSTCHGLEGKGEGAAAVYLSPKPRDFTEGIFKFQSTPAGALPT